MTLVGLREYLRNLELKKRILIVDDDSAVSSVAAEMVRALGHSAVVAWGLESALTVWQQTDRAFDIAILDYTWVLIAELRSASGCSQKSRIFRF